MRSLITALVACSFIVAAAPADAQNIRLNPRIGLYVPLSDLGEAEAAADQVASLEGSLAIGLGVELDLPLLPFGVRGNLDYATGATVSREGVDTDAGEATVMAVVADVMFRPLPRVVVLQPYLFAGGGLRQYDFDAADFRDASDPTIHLGAGLDFALGPIKLNAELGDYLSWYEIREGSGSETQHDLFITVGFSIGML